MDLTTVILSVMLVVLPPKIGVERSRFLPPAARESVEQRTQRYREIAEAVALVSEEKPIFPREHAGVLRTAALLLAVSYHESSWHRHVDLGAGPGARGDKGRSWCLAQLHVGEGETPEGWTGEQLVADRTRCFEAARNALQKSLATCRANPAGERLAAYASGRCDAGIEASQRRWATAGRILHRLKTAK